MNRQCGKLLTFFFMFMLFYGVVGWPQSTIPRVHIGQIRGQARLPDGHPAPAGSTVYLEMQGGGTASQTQTDSQGKFEFMQVSPAVYEVSIRVFGYLAEPQTADLTGIPTAYVIFALKPDPSRTAPAVPAGPGASISALDAGAPDEARKNVDSARELLNTGKHLDKSIELLKKAVAQYPQYPEAYLQMGMVYSAQKNWNQAEEFLQKSVDLNKANGNAFVALGSVKNEKANYAEAEKSLLTAVELLPESPDAHFELGRAYWGLQRWDLAEQQVARANQLRPDDAGQHILMGNIMLRERNAPGALKEFQKAVRLDPKGPMAEPTRQMIGRIQAALAQAEKQKK